MNPKLAAMLSLAGVVTIAAGVSVYVYTPQPATRTVAELKDAGILEGQKLVEECQEKMTKQTKNRIEVNQPGLLRPGQFYGRVARSARCFNPDGGNCLRPSDGLARVADLEGHLIVVSLRADAGSIDSGIEVDDGGDNDNIDDALQFDKAGCVVHTCPMWDDLVDAGLRVDPFGGCLGGVGTLALQPAPCMIPNGWNRGADGGWCEETECLSPSSPGGYRPCAVGDTCGEVDCKFTGPFGLADGGARWNGFNAKPREFAVGACVPVVCNVASGDVPAEWL